MFSTRINKNLILVFMVSISEFIQLQSITIKDHSKLVSLMNRIYPPAYNYIWTNKDCNFYFERFYNLNNFKNELAEKEAEYYFVYYETKLTGILRVHFNKALKTMPKKSGCYVNRIYLSEETQGKGIGLKLMNWVEQRAKANENDLIWLEAMDSKKQALQFYSKLGFTKSHKERLDFEPLLVDFREMIVFFKTLQ